MTTLHTLGILSTSFTWNAFPTVLKEFPHILSTCWLLFFHSAVLLIPNHTNSVEVGWLWRPDHLMQHSPSWSNSPYTAWRCVGSLSCWKTNDSPTKRKPDGLADCCRRLWFKLENITRQCYQQSTPTPPPPCFTVGTTHAEVIRSPTLRLTKSWLLEPKKSQIWKTDFHRSNCTGPLLVFLGPSKSLLIGVL
jgi:hypothetical protein